MHTLGFFGSQTENHMPGPSSQQGGFSIVATHFLGCSLLRVDFFSFVLQGYGNKKTLLD